MKYYVVKYGCTYLKNWDEYWSAWTTESGDALVFDTLEEAVRVAEVVEAEAVPGRAA